MNKEEFFREQLRLISIAESICDQILSNCETDSFHVHGFGSYYPQECLKNLKTMKFGIILELKNEIPQEAD